MRRKEGVMRYVEIAMAAIAVLHLFGEKMRAAEAPASTYSITDLGSLGGGRTSPMGINNRGAVVGFSATVEGLTRAFLYTGGSLVDLGTLGGDESFAYRINDNGIIVGRAQDSSGRFRAFMTTISGARGIELTSLDPRVDGDFSAALGVNSVGEVTGYYTTAGDHMSARNRVFFYHDSRVEDLGTFGGEDGRVVAVNDGRSMVGFFSSEPHADYAQHRSFLSTGGKLVPIGSLGGQLTTARDLNSRNEVVGDGDAGHGAHHAFLFAGGTLRDLGTLAGGLQSAAYGINERGDIVGFSEGSDHSARAVIVTAGVMRDLNGLIPSGSGWVLTEARDINDAGRIVGTGWRDGEQRGFLLTPTDDE
jgi:probable HAF family extracellular repeat protein